MSDPILRPFQPEDAMRILNRDGSHAPKANLIRQAEQGPAFTAWIDDQPIGCAGLVLPWPGVGTAWMVVSEDMQGHGLWLTRTVKHFLEDMQRRHRLHRIEAIALEDSPRNQAWLEAVGFTKEQNGVAQAMLMDRRSVVRYELIGARHG